MVDLYVGNLFVLVGYQCCGFGDIGVLVVYWCYVVEYDIVDLGGIQVVVLLDCV